MIEMYRRAKFLELLIEIRQEMAHEADYDAELFVELARHGSGAANVRKRKKLTTPRQGRSVDPDAEPLRLDNSAVK